MEGVRQCNGDEYFELLKRAVVASLRISQDSMSALIELGFPQIKKLYTVGQFFY